MPLNYAQLPPSFFNELSENAGLAFGMIDWVWSTGLEGSYPAQTPTMGDYRKALTLLCEKVNEIRHPPGFMLRSPSDPLYFPDETNLVQASPPIERTRVFHASAQQFIYMLEKYFDALACRHLKLEENAQGAQGDFSEELFSQEEIIKFAKNNFGENQVRCVEKVMKAVVSYYSHPNTANQSLVVQSSAALSKAFASTGYYIHIATIRAQNGGTRQDLLYGEIGHIRKYSLSGSTAKANRPSSLEIYYVRNLTIRNMPAPLYLVQGVTVPFGNDDSVSLVSIDSQMLEYEALKKAKNSWARTQWQELTQGWSPQEIAYIFNEQVTYHELAHQWRRSFGYGRERNASVEEGSSTYAGVAFSEYPIAALLFLVLIYAQDEKNSGSTDLGFDFNNDYSKGLMEFLMDLATQYGVKIPDGNDRLKTEWVKELVEKIRSQTTNYEVNESILRTHIAYAYAKRFGVPLLPLKSTIPQEKVLFQ